jgi:alpha-tubulin suppressor-like RCC1 family protein
MENDVPQVYLLGKTYLTNNETFYIRNDSIIHMAAGDRHTIITTESGRVYAFGDNNSGRRKIKKKKAFRCFFNWKYF